MASGASNHTTNNSNALCHVQPYDGESTIQTINASYVQIIAIANVSFKITDMFLTSQLFTDLISANQLVDDNCAINFSIDGCVVQD